jgi:hypothetical protein
MEESTKQKHKYMERGAKAGDALGWLGIWLPLPLFVIVSIIFAGIGAVIGFIAYLTKSRIKKRGE